MATLLAGQRDSDGRAYQLLLSTASPKPGVSTMVSRRWTPPSFMRTFDCSTCPQQALTQISPNPSIPQFILKFTGKLKSWREDENLEYSHTPSMTFQCYFVSVEMMREIRVSRWTDKECGEQSSLWTHEESLRSALISKLRRNSWSADGWTLI